MSKRNVPKIQHYVPQFILRNFCIGNTAKICTYIKSNGKVFRSNTKKVAAEKGFYDLTIRGISATLEFSLSELEGKSSSILNKIIEDGSLINVSKRDKKLLSYFFATQFIRVPRIREHYKQINDVMISVVEKMGFDSKNHPQILSGEDDLKALSIAGMGEMVSVLAPHFYNKDWILFKAPSGSSYYISDNPVTLQNLIDYGPRGSLGIAVRGIEIYFPISKVYSLGMICPSYKEIIDNNFNKLDFFRKYEIDPGLEINREKIENMKKYKSCMETGIAFQSILENVNNKNSLQVMYSSRFIFSKDDDFSLAKEMINKNPEFRFPPQIQHNQ